MIWDVRDAAAIRLIAGFAWQREFTDLQRHQWTIRARWPGAVIDCQRPFMFPYCWRSTHGHPRLDEGAASSVWGRWLPPNDRGIGDRCRGQTA
jgi:hypothetical protein